MSQTEDGDGPLGLGPGGVLPTLSHEIRTPLNAILGMSELVLDGDLSSEQRALMTRVRSAAEAVVNLVDDLLDAARLDAGEMRVARSEFAPRELVEDVADTLALRADAGFVQLIVDVAADVPPLVLGDPVRTRQILTNLLSNALKFTERGEVLVHVERAAESPLRLAFTVVDTGIGIAADALEDIFRPFVRTGNELQRGTGLGLHLCQRLVTLLGGEITVKSELGEGSRFAFELPFAAVRETASRRDPSPLIGSVVGIADPSQRARVAMRSLMRSLGVELVEGGTIEALKAAGSRFDAVLVDRWVADLDDAPSLGSTPRILLSARSRGTRAAAQRAGASETLAKPWRAALVLHALARAMGVSTSGAPSQESIPAGARVRARVLLAEDDPDNRGLLRRMLEREGCRVELARDGVIALERARARMHDLILTDVQMPRLDGLSFARAFRDHEREEGLERTPMVAVTAYALPSYRSAAEDAGIDDFIPKPIRQQTLRGVLDTFLDPRPVVLIVEDDPTMRDLLARFLGARGRYRTATAGSEAEALGLLGRRRVSGVLIDLVLGLGSGYALARAIRAREGDARMPLLAVTAYEPEDVRERCMRAGFDAVLPKPARRRELIAAIEPWFGDDSAGAAGSTLVPPTPAAAESLGVVVIADEDVSELLPEFFRNRWAAYRRGSAALEAGDMEVLERLGHGLKGVGSAYGFAELTVIGRRLEDAAVEGDLEAVRAANEQLAETLEGLVAQTAPGYFVRARDYRET